MEFITSTLAVVDFITHYQRSIILLVLKLSYFKNSISNYTANKIFWITNRPNAPFETLHLCYINIWQQHRINAQKDQSVEIYSQNNIYKYHTTNFDPVEVLFNGELLNASLQSNPFLISLPFLINIQNWSYKILIMIPWKFKLYPEVNK